MLRPRSTGFIWGYEQNMFGGNLQWADPADAQEVGRQVAAQLIDRHGLKIDRSGSPEVHEEAITILTDALKVIDYSALPTERRVNILHGLIDALGESGVLGGEPEWATTQEALVTIGGERNV